MRGPLEGIAILDLGTPTPGKYCTFLLADLGAAVLRVERPPEGQGPIPTEDLILNRGKRSMTLNLRAEEGREVLYRLAERADVVLESNRPGVAERLGIDYERLSRRNRRLVYCSLTGFGQDGPYRLRPAYDLIFMAMSGALQAAHGRGVPPSPPDLYLADSVSGLMAALAISVALLARARDGDGRYLDLAMFDSIFSVLSPSHGLQPGALSAAGPQPEAWSSPLYAVYETADGRAVALGAIRPASRRDLLRELGRPELMEQTGSGEGAARLAEFLRSTFRQATADEWVERLAKLDIEIGAVRTPEEAFDDPQLAYRRMVIGTIHPKAGELRQIGTPLRAGHDVVAERMTPAPAVGANTEEVLLELGFDSRAITRLRESGTV